MSIPQYPTTGPTHQGMLASLRAVRSLFEPNGFTVRDEKEQDFGVDGTIEIGDYDPATQYYSWFNLRAYFQLKHTSAPNILKDGSISYPIETKNLNYLNTQLRALYLLYDLKNDQLYMRWHHHIIVELMRSNSRWHEQETINVHFSRIVTKETLIEIETEIFAHARQVLQLHDGPGLVRNFNAQHVPDSLIAHEPFVGRKHEFALLENNIAPNAVLPVIGLSDSGKTELIAHILNHQAIMKRVAGKFPLPLGLLFVDLGPHISNRVLRSLAFSLGVSKLRGLEEIELDEVVAKRQAQALLLGQILPARLQQCSVLAVFENSQEVIADMTERKDLEQVLASDVFRNGAAIIIYHHSPFPLTGEKRLVKNAIQLANLPRPDAEELLAYLVKNPSLAKDAVKDAEGIEEVLIPGAIIRGAEDFKQRLESGSIDRAGTVLFESVFNASSLNARHILAAVNCDQILHPDGTLGFLVTLLVMAVLADIDITEDLLNDAGLPVPPFRVLEDIHWIARKSRGYRLTDIGRNGLRYEARLLLNEDQSSVNRSTLSESIVSLLDVLGKVNFDDEMERHSRAIEASIAWLRSQVPTAGDVQDRLLAALLPYTVDDMIFPLSQRESTEFNERIHVSDHVNNLSSLTAEIAAITRYGSDSKTFLEKFRKAVEIASEANFLSPQNLRALDTAAYICARRFRLNKEVLQVRQSLIPRLKRIISQGALVSVGSLKWSISWMLNTADLYLRTGDTSSINELLKDVTEMLQMMPQPNQPHEVIDWNRLWLRLRRVEGKAVSDQPTRVRKFQEAVSYALSSFIVSEGHEQLLRLYINCVYHLVNEMKGDVQRANIVDVALENLTQVYGDTEGWTIYVRCLAAALIRDAANLDEDMEQQFQQTQKALNLLAPIKKEAISLTKLGDTSALLALIRTQVRWASCQWYMGKVSDSNLTHTEARKLSRIALDTAPSAEVWDVALYLQDQENGSLVEGEWIPDPFNTPRKEIQPNLRKLIAASRTWAYKLAAPGPDVGEVVLWCLRREWIAEGSYERWAPHRIAAEEDWDHLPKERKWEILKRLHKERQSNLDAIERRFGAFLNLYLMRARNEAQFQRSIAIYGNHQFETDTTFKVFTAAAKIWPDDTRIWEAEANLHNYLWNFAEAILGYRKIRVATTNGNQRREITIALVSNLLTVAIYCSDLKFPDGTIVNKDEIIAEARSLLAELEGFKHGSRAISILRDRVEYEAGVEIDWASIDAAFNVVIGGVDSYLDTVVHNLDELLYTKPTLTSDLASIVYENFTEASALRSMGSLYLRRAEKRGGADPMLDCQRAYAIYNACRILERSLFGKELPITSYQRARAIMTGILISYNPNPFPAYLGNKRNLLGVADALFQSAASKTVNFFHNEIRQRIKEVARIKKDLM